jgi:hypothetical protein
MLDGTCRIHQQLKHNKMKKILVYFKLPGVSTPKYQQIWDDLRATGNDTPKGLVHHTGAMEGNNLIVVDVWESQEAFDQFGATLGPLMMKHNMPDEKPSIFPVLYDYVTEKVPFPKAEV